MLPNDKKKKILYLIEQAGVLAFMPRSGWRQVGGNDTDTIASHSHHVSLIAYCISRMEGLTHAEGLQSLAMGALHDLSEARTGDNDFVTKNYAKMDEDRAVADQFTGIPFGKDLQRELEEYEQRESHAAKCAKDADIVAQIYMEWLLAWRGNKLAEKWYKGSLVNRVPALRTESARKLVELIQNSSPDEWWWKDLVDNNLNLDHLNGKR